jgi:hypothetical protein
MFKFILSFFRKKVLHYRTPVEVISGAFLPRSNMSRKGFVDFPLPKNKHDAIWVKLEGYPYPIPYERDEIKIIDEK